MGKIQLLDNVTANQIAAGEVVERPAAVVKELVENAIDAGASAITIQISGGGLESIRVSDDGSGMAAEDVPLALQRHATSKIKSAADLAVVTSLGFRGEALPSIAAVSRFQLTTRQPEELVGTEIVVHGGQLIKIDEAGSPIGTEIRVEGLFYNTPARLKFSKSEGAENARITDTVQRLALAWPEISFNLTVNEKSQLVTVGNGKLEDAAAQVLGRQNMRQMLPLEWQGSLVELSGFVAKPALVRANRNLQYFFVNRRPVRSPLLSDALQTAYHTLLPRNRFPAAVLLLKIDPQEVDVNVHPAKREIRFSRERDLYRQVLAGVKDALQQTDLGFELGVPRTSVVRENPSNVNFYELLPRQQTTAQNSFISVQPPEMPVSKFATEPLIQQGGAISPFPRLQPIGQYLATYLLAQSEAGELYVVDQHAAHERILYEQLKKELSQGSITVQEVIPQTFELDPLAAAALEKSLDFFATLGLTFETFGNNTFILRSIPAFSHRCLNQDDLTEIIAVVREEAAGTTVFFERTLQMMACKAAIKANQLMERREMETLLERLADTDGPFTCPHGRPTVLVFSEQALARNFRRHT
ncbi:MAG: DNA mismatch repair endonuclease MutL [Firmicutes bacterium]|jgi:DNA mismatch repair protein MutL|nr:DNA mismatch repair endonuclease MutL [Dethiobacter sp.]MCL4462482.1 DNA mismatch repair endonuclease MutL [Bacillota bacterium]MCL5993723.1 DNA mismatch repair endonuclease MutL [Bacillota bacterium]